MSVVDGIVVNFGLAHKMYGPCGTYTTAFANQERIDVKVHCRWCHMICCKRKKDAIDYPLMSSVIYSPLV